MEETGKMIGLSDICSIFGCERQKGRKIMNVALQMKYAAKIGRSVYMTEDDLKRYLLFIKGKKVII